MTKLEELYNKVKQSDVDVPTDEWAKTVTLDEACEGSVILKRNRLWAIKTDCHKYYIGLLEDHICDTMDIKIIKPRTRIRHNDTGKMYVVYQTELNTVENVMNGDCYLYTTTTGDIFTNKEVEPLSLEDVLNEITNELRSVKIGDIITTYNSTMINTSFLVIDISDNNMTVVEVLESSYRSIPNGVDVIEEYLPLSDNTYNINIGHKFITVTVEYDEGYDREIGFSNKVGNGILGRLHPNTNTIMIDLGYRDPTTTMLR